MRILLTTDVVGGVWDHATTLRRRLVERGHDVTLAVLGAGPGADRLEMLPPNVEWVCRAFELEWVDGGLADCDAAAEWIAAEADAIDADVVHLNQLTYAHRMDRPTVVAVHSDAWSWFSEVLGMAPTGDARWRAYREAVVRSLSAADAVVAPSAYQAELTQRHYGRAVDEVVLNGIAPSGSSPESTRVSPPVRLPWSLATVGRAWDPAKGHAVLDDALGRVRRPWTGALAGDVDGPEGQRFRPARLRHLGRLPSEGVRRLLTRSSVYVAPSLYEPFGLAPVEAAMAECALVLSDIGSFRELWEDDALYFPKGDAEALARMLDRLHADPGLQRDLGARAAHRARARFGEHRMAERYARLYQSLRHGRPTRRPESRERGSAEDARVQRSAAS